MDEERAHTYSDLKDALLTKFDISPETYRQKFRTVTIPAGENPAETYHRLKGLYRRWIRPEQHTKEQIGEQIILEQLLRVFPADIRTWVKEHEPTEGLAAAKLAQQYLNARRGGPAPYQGGPGRQTPAQTSSARVHTQQSADSNHAASQRGPGSSLANPPPTCEPHRKHHAQQAKPGLEGNVITRTTDSPEQSAEWRCPR
uniref:SCAN box domain-containing protein n=1 Tax=Knipowitschia caucasica TaxID=637954 RepID=A0AAV2MIP9_KNICA